MVFPKNETKLASCTSFVESGQIFLFFLHARIPFQHVRGDGAQRATPGCGGGGGGRGGHRSHTCRSGEGAGAAGGGGSSECAEHSDWLYAPHRKASTCTQALSQSRRSSAYASRTLESYYPSVRQHVRCYRPFRILFVASGGSDHCSENVVLPRRFRTFHVLTMCARMSVYHNHACKAG